MEESFRDLKSLLGLGKLMNKRQEYMKKVIALVLLAYGLGLLAGEEIRDMAYGGKSQHQLFSGLFVLLKQARQVDKEIMQAAVRQVTRLWRQLLLPLVPSHD